MASVFGAYDAMQLDMQAVRHVWYMKSVHPDAGYRKAAEQCMQDYTDFADSHDLSPAFYRRVAGIDLALASPAEQLMVQNQLRDFRQAGVDRDEKTRAQVRELKRQITELGNTYNRQIREDTRYVETTVEGLAQPAARGTAESRSPWWSGRERSAPREGADSPPGRGLSDAAVSPGPAPSPGRPVAARPGS